ncbi:VOC family protein [Streptomyces sp. NPDC054797]
MTPTVGRGRVVAKLLSMGAKEYEGPVERGPGFVTASVVDPFGNVLGVMHNAHYLEVLAGARAGAGAVGGDAA